MQQYMEATEIPGDAPTQVDGLAATALLWAFAEQRPGLNTEDYQGAPQALAQDRNELRRDLADARRLLAYVAERNERADGITLEHYQRAAGRAFAGRLSIGPVRTGGVTKLAVDYTPGQMPAMEYRNAVAAVTADTIRQWWREDERNTATAHDRARAILGKGIADRYFR